MIKLAFKLVVFLAGVGSGIYIAAHFPALASKVSDAEANQINAAVAKAKVDVLTEVVNDEQTKPAASSTLLSAASGFVGGGSPTADPTTDKHKALLAKYQQDLTAANAK